MVLIVIKSWNIYFIFFPLKIYFENFNMQNEKLGNAATKAFHTLYKFLHCHYHLKTFFARLFVSINGNLALSLLFQCLFFFKQFFYDSSRSPIDMVFNRTQHFFIVGKKFSNLRFPRFLDHYYALNLFSVIYYKFRLQN